MDSRLAALIGDYQSAMRAAVALLAASGIPLPESNTAWVGTQIPHKGTLEGGIPYYKHGYGCAVHFPSGTVDFDFGAEGQIDGFDCWRLAAFADGRISQYGISSESELKAIFESAAKAKAAVYSGYILHYVARG